MELNQVKLLNLPKFEDNRGNLSFVEEFNQIPFEIKRTYWIYDVPGGQVRGGHAFKEQEEIIIALSGSFDVIVDDGHEKRTFSLSRSYYGLFIPSKLWRSMENFSTNSLSMILASTAFNKEDYIFDYELFCKERNKNG